MRPRAAVGAGLGGLLLIVAAACSDTGSAEPTAPSLDPVTTTIPAPSTTPAPLPTTAETPATESTSSEPTDTSAPAPPSAAPTDVGTTQAPPPTATPAPSTTDPGITGPTFSDQLGTRVDTAPGVNTRGDTRELMPGLWVHIAWEADPNDPSVFTVREEDIPILEAYANAVLTYYEASTSTVRVDPIRFSSYFLDDGAKYEEAFANHRRAGEVEDISSGVTSRPYVADRDEDGRTAVVLDCVLDGGHWRSQDAAAEGRVRPNGVIATMVFDGAWKIDLAGTEEQACVG